MSLQWTGALTDLVQVVEVMAGCAQHDCGEAPLCKDQAPRAHETDGERWRPPEVSEFKMRVIQQTRGPISALILLR